MAHVNSEKVKLLTRLHRISGQLTAIARAVEEDGECARVLQQATACRGALDSFIFEVIEDHIREHMMAREGEVPQSRDQAGEELIGILKSYIK
jgi:DNA-binding FrmR family transcriptional regulator